MHVAFIPYGKREHVERFLRDMEAQKHLLPMIKDGETKAIWIDGQVRVCPFGIYEYVFPKEDLDAVLTTIGFDEKAPYNINPKIPIIRKLFKYKKNPKFNTDKKYLWNREHVSIIPIGIREDGQIIGSEELDRGFSHEAI